MPSGKKRKRHKMSTHKRKKRLRKNRHKKKQIQSHLTDYLFPKKKSVVNTELVIRSAKESIDIVVLKEGRLIELHQLPLDQNICSVFDIYLAKVKKVASSLNAAFVDIGQEKDAFLHYHDLGPFFNSANSFIHDSINKKVTKWNNLKPNFKEICLQIIIIFTNMFYRNYIKHI